MGPHAGDAQRGSPDPAPPRPAPQEPAQARAGTTEPMRPVLLAVDGPGLLVRCSRAARSRPLAASDGTPTAALMMYIASLSHKIRLHAPDYLVIAWDGPLARSWRKSLHPGYKARRPSYPAGVNMARIVDFGIAAGMRQLLVRRFEADDLLAAAQRSFRAEFPDGRMIICSDDADLLQLADGHTDIAGFAADNPVTAQDIEEAWGVPPRCLPMVRALAGDRSDGIPGLRGIGLAKAVAMVRAADFAWPPPLDGAEDTIEAYREIIDLVDPSNPPEAFTRIGFFAISAHAKWRAPVDGAIQEFLLKYDLLDLHKRLTEGRLW